MSMRGWAGLFVLATMAMVGCSNSESTVTLRVVSDLAPSVDVAVVEADLFNGAYGADTQRGSVQRRVSSSDALARGLVIGAFDSLASGTYSARVVLWNAAHRITGERVVVFELRRDMTITAFVTADCANVECPNSGAPSLTACLHGTCVDPRCTPETPEHCPQELVCDQDAQCGEASVACAQSICLDHLCIEAPRDNACDATEYCAHAVGCAPIDGPVMPGGPDPRCGTVCLDDALPCHYGYFACQNDTSGGTVLTCTSFVARPVGAPCGQDLACDENAECVAVEAMDGGVMDASIPRDASTDARIADARVADARVDARADARADAPPDGPPPMPCTPNPCGVGSCTEHGEEYECVCPSGYEAPLRGGTCTDIDECTLGTDTCAMTQHCANAPSTYSCHDPISVANGVYNKCVLFDNGEIKCSIASWTGTPTTMPSNAIGLPVRATSIVSGRSTDSYFCVIDDEDQILCWGSNVNGVLGVGDTNWRQPEDAIAIPFGQRVLAADTGARHMCAILEDHTVRCWGYGFYLGYPGVDDLYAPSDTPLAITGTPIAISAGERTSCVLLDDATTWCWASYAPGGRTPYAVPWGQAVLDVKVRGDSVCALLADRTVECVADLSVGASTPIALSGPAAALYATGGHACAVLQDDTTECWGRNGSGQLGRGYAYAVDDENMPEPIALSAAPVQLSLAWGSSFALLPDHTLSAWGANDSSDLALGILPRSFSPVTAYSGPGPVTSLRSSAYSSCAMIGSTPQCWGNNYYDQFGVGDRKNRIGLRAMTEYDASDAFHLGSNYTCLQDGTTLQCWGLNNYGQLGLGDTTTRNAPDATFDLGQQIDQVALGPSHACAVLHDGSVSCWGANGWGALGQGDRMDRSTPFSVLGIGGTVAKMALGAYHSCALLTSGAVKCWGSNNEGQLGNGSTPGADTQLDAPPSTPIVFGQNAIDITVGDAHSCALLADGTVACWGFNGNGELATDDSMSRTSPITIALATTARSINAGSNHTCAILTDDSVQCWGANGAGQLGSGDTTRHSAPATPITFSSTPTIVSGGGDFSCALLSSEQKIVCWGSNAVAQLGTSQGLFWAPSPPLNVRGRGVIYDAF